MLARRRTDCLETWLIVREDWLGTVSQPTVTATLLRSVYMLQEIPAQVVSEPAAEPGGCEDVTAAERSRRGAVL